MLSIFQDALSVTLFAALIAFIPSLLITLIGSALVKKRSRVPELRLRRGARTAWTLLMASFVLLQLAMHFRMKKMLEPDWKEFVQHARLNDGSEVEVSYDPLMKRDHLLEESGYVGLGGWYAKWCRGTPCSQDRMIYLYLPFL